MPKTFQIRNVPDELYRTMKVRAAQAGMTFSGYLLSEIEQIAEKPSLHEMLKRLSKEKPVELDEPQEVTIRRRPNADDDMDSGLRNLPANEERVEASIAVVDVYALDAL